MAKEPEQTQVQGQGDQSAQANASATQTPAPDSTTQKDASSQQVDPVETLQRQFDELNARYKNLESEHTKVSQKATQDNELLETIRPFVDWGAIQQGTEQPKATDQQSGIDNEDETSFISRAEHKRELQNVVNQVSKIVGTTTFVTNFRQKFPDLGDGGPKEALVAGFFDDRLKKSANPNDPKSRQQAFADAIQDTRKFIKDQQEIGRQAADAEKQKQTVAQKAAAGAAAAGLGSFGVTTPAPEQPVPTDTDYVKQRQSQREQRKTTIYA